MKYASSRFSPFFLVKKRWLFVFQLGHLNFADPDFK